MLTHNDLRVSSGRVFCVCLQRCVEEALKYEIADYQAEDIAEVLRTIDMSEAQVIQGPTRMDNIKEWLKPQLIWFIVGLIFYF